jgi:hypothetical protein
VVWGKLGFQPETVQSDALPCVSSRMSVE